MKGHIIVYPQCPSGIARVLPPSLDELTTLICVLFVGLSPPTNEWIHAKAKPLAVHHEKVRVALVWLKNYNKYYKDITINHGMLDELKETQNLPVHIKHVLPSHVNDSLTARYDSTAPLVSSEPDRIAPAIPFQNVVITNVDGHAPSNELCAAAVQHVKKKGGGYIKMPHDPTPVNKFFNPSLFPIIYLTLLLYGVGGYEENL